MFTTVSGLALEGETLAPAPPAWARALGRARGGRASLFASVSATAVAPAPARPPPGAGKAEPRTHTAFPPEFCHIVDAHCPALAGVGVRSKRLLGVKNIDGKEEKGRGGAGGGRRVYALGVYVDEGAVRTLAAGRGGEGQALLDAVAADAHTPKTVRVVVTTGVLTRPRFLKGVRESLAPKLAKIGAAAALDDFEALFDGAEFSRGTELAFSNAPDGRLAVSVAGREVGRVASPAFAPVFFSLYLGADAVSPGGRDDVAAGLSRLLAAVPEA